MLSWTDAGKARSAPENTNISNRKALTELACESEELGVPDSKQSTGWGCPEATDLKNQTIAAAE